MKALVAEIAYNAAQARLLAEAEEAEAETKARDKILFCTINDTDVEIVADAGSSELEQDGETVTNLTEMNVHVTDASSRSFSSLKVGFNDLGRIWALFTFKFEKSIKFDHVTDVFNNLEARKRFLHFMANNCLDLFLSRQNRFMKLSLLNLCQYVDSIKVTIVSATDLVNADALLGGRVDAMFGGKSDPYVIVKLGEEKFKTKTMKNNLNPEFNEEFTFQWNQKDDLLLDVMDKDMISKDGKRIFSQFIFIVVCYIT